MNIAEYCFQKRTVTFGLAIAVTLAGVLSYFKLGRLEDPEYTIRCAQVFTAYPGATAEEVAERVTDPIETAVQRLGKVKHVTSTSYPGKSIVLVELQDRFENADLPQIWDELRRKVTDMQDTLPEGCSEPLVYDDYGDVYGVFYALSGDGYGYAELKDFAKELRRELLLCKDVAKIDFIGERDETIYLEVPRGKIAALGLTPDQIARALSGQNTPTDAGHVRFGEKYVRIFPSGTVNTIEALGHVRIADGIFLKDIAEVRRGYEEPPDVIVKRNGKPCIGIGISTAKGGNVITMGNDVERRMRELVADMPVGIGIDVISHQATSVRVAVDGFVENLLESVILVIAVLLLTMGMRSGLLIGGVLIMTVLATVWVMDMMGLMFERISLGAFIIALGMLVDNAIVITEAVLVAAQRGTSKKDAAIAIVRQTQWALLGGTAIAVLSFAPIGAVRSSTGEYCRSLFLVILISLMISWILAITVTPLLAEKFLAVKRAKDETKPARDPYDSVFFRGYRRFLEWCIDNRGFVLLTLVCLLLASIFAFGHVDQNFFPESTRPQFMVHVWLPEGTHIESTDAHVQAVSDYVKTLPGVTGISTFTGRGAMRFLLTYTPEDNDTAYGILLVDVENDGVIANLMEKIESEGPALVADAMVACQRFTLGPGDPNKIQLRLMGPDAQTLRAFGERAVAILREDPRLKQIQYDWRNRAEMLRPIVSEARASKLGLSRADVARAYRAATDGLPVGSFLERDEAIPIVLRSKSALTDAWAWSPALGDAVPVLQLVDGMESVSEECLLKRRDRRLCLTVKCNPKEGETAATAFERVRPKLDALTATLPTGYIAEWGGEYEDTQTANNELAPTYAPILIAMALAVLMLFNSWKRTFVIFLTLPLILVGVVGGLLAFDKPFGFMALLGLLSLVGMQVKTAIVLMDEIAANIDRGQPIYEAVVNAGVSRLRPVFNASVTTILGMLPLVVDAFYSAMAVTIMFGLTFATILTMVVIPVNYALVFRVRK